MRVFLSSVGLVVAGEIAAEMSETVSRPTSVGSFELLQLQLDLACDMRHQIILLRAMILDVNMPCYATPHRLWVAILASLRLVAALDVESFAFPGSWTSSSGKAGDISGFAPTSAAADSEKFPVFVWLTGTGMSYWTDDDQVYTQEMAERGFVAASVKYPSRPYPGQCGEF